jgi:hypothetical protein
MFKLEHISDETAYFVQSIFVCDSEQPGFVGNGSFYPRTAVRSFSPEYSPRMFSSISTWFGYLVDRLAFNFDSHSDQGRVVFITSYLGGSSVVPVCLPTELDTFNNLIKFYTILEGEVVLLDLYSDQVGFSLEENDPSTLNSNSETNSLSTSRDYFASSSQSSSSSCFTLYSYSSSFSLS